MEMTAPAKPKHLLKRDGSVKDFDSEKIVRAVAKAGKATQEFDEAIARAIVEERVLPKLCTDRPGITLHIEEVQDAVRCLALALPRRLLHAAARLLRLR